MRNQFLGFANQIIAQHTQGGGPFDSAAMIFPEAAEQAAGETVQNSYVTNRYRIQRITEENYLYQQNFQLLNQLYEKQTFRNFYPTVEKQVEKLISREMPELEEKLTVRMAQEIHRLVREGGTEQLTVLKERLEKTERETLEKELRRERTHTERLEKELWREQTHTERIREELRTEVQKDRIHTERLREELQRERFHTEQTEREQIHTEQARTEAELQTVPVHTESMREELRTVPADTEHRYREQGRGSGRGAEPGQEKKPGETAPSGDRGAQEIWKLREKEIREKELRDREVLEKEIQTKEIQEKEVREKEIREKKIREKQLVLLRKIENIYNSSYRAEFRVPGRRIGNAGAAVMTNAAAGSSEIAIRSNAGSAPSGIERLLLRTERMLDVSTGYLPMSLLYDMEEQEAAEKQGQKAVESEAWKSDGLVQNQTGRRDVTETPGTQRNRQQSTVEPMQLVQRQSSAAELTQTEQLWHDTAGQRAEQLSIPGSRWQSPAEAKNAPGQTQITSGTPGQPIGQTPVEAGQFRTPGHGISGQLIPGDSERGSQARPELAEVPMVHAASETTGPEEAGENTGRSAEPGKLPGVAEQTVQETVQNTVQKIVRETVENVLQNTVEKTTGHIIEKKIEKETEKKAQQTAEQVFQKAEGEKVLQTAVEQTLQKPAEQRTLQTIVENRVRDTVQNTAGYRMLQKAAQPGMPGDSFGIPQIGNGFQPVEMLQGETLEAIQPLGTPGLPYPRQMQSPGVIPQAAQIRQATRNGQPTLIRAFQMQAAGRRAASRQTSPGQTLETASMVYPEDREAKEQEASRRQMQEHIRNVTEELQEVRRSVRTEKKLQVEKQRELVREVITKDPELLTENAVSASVGRQVQKEVERYMDESLQNMTNRVYRKLEQKLRTERERRGLV
ncbi:hypothetical protein ACTNCH_00625 [Candidatus Merdisoma sp. HCP28S3_D10]|uniref:hypothetical protein n=1 Tax=unclassified Candidatus Merdisoma TaxID=3099611 RepID=UPI003F8C465B